jgi:hypothetical protein
MQKPARKGVTSNAMFGVFPTDFIDFVLIKPLLRAGFWIKKPVHLAIKLAP